MNWEVFPLLSSEKVCVEFILYLLNIFMSSIFRMIILEKVYSWVFAFFFSFLFLLKSNIISTFQLRYLDHLYSVKLFIWLKIYYLPICLFCVWIWKLHFFIFYKNRLCPSVKNISKEGLQRRMNFMIHFLIPTKI